MKKPSVSTWLAALLLCAPAIALAGGDLTSEFSGKGSIRNTRHNMTQREPGNTGLDGAQMDPYRNNYGEVCVYCHTPHGANTQPGINKAPLWNRTYKATTYTTYDQLGTSTLTTGAVSQPGTNSLTCLSCHDGQVAIDSIINMPGPGKYSSSQETSTSDTFLFDWDKQLRDHDKLALTGGGLTGCLACHQPGLRAAATDFTVFALGTDLRNDHPIGVTFPVGSDDFNQPDRTKGVSTYFDKDGNNAMGAAEVRTYNAKVECASCHDPHGVPKGSAPGLMGDRASANFNKSFLRVQNDNSDLCLTCHIK